MNDKGKPFVIFGAGNFAGLLLSLLKELNREVVAFCSDANPFERNTELGQLPIISPQDLLQNYCPEKVSMALGFVGHDMQRRRGERFQQMKELGYSFPNIIQEGAKVSSDINGEGNIIFSGAVIGFQCVIGSCNIIWQNVSIPHDNKIGDFNNFGPGSSLAGYAEIGSYCFLGAGSSVNNGKRIGDAALLGANAFAREDVSSGTVLVAPKSYILEGKRGVDFA